MCICARPSLWVAAVALIGGHAEARADLIYYNDGTVNDFDETFGDVAFGVPYNGAFEPGGFLDGTPDDIPPYNTNANLGLVTLQGAAGGVAGGGFRQMVPMQNGGMRGAIIIPYGSEAARKGPAGANWIANFRNAGAFLGTDPRTAVQRWRDGIQLNNGTITKLVKYLGDPQVSISPDDLLPSQLDPIDLPAVTAALADANNLIFFWEVTGTRPMDALDLFFGDFEQNTGYLDVLHHFPYIAVLEDVSPADFGIDPATAFIAQFNGDSLGGTGGFNQAAFVVVADLAVPEPGTFTLLGTGLVVVLVGGGRRMRRGGTDEHFLGNSGCTRPGAFSAR